MCISWNDLVITNSSLNKPKSVPCIFFFLQQVPGTQPPTLTYLLVSNSLFFTVSKDKHPSSFHLKCCEGNFCKEFERKWQGKAMWEGHKVSKRLRLVLTSGKPLGLQSSIVIFLVWDTPQHWCCTSPSSEKASILCVTLSKCQPFLALLSSSIIWQW